MNIITEIVKFIVSIFHNDGYAQQWQDRYSDRVKDNA